MPYPEQLGGPPDPFAQINPDPMAAATAPPQSPEELQQRVSGWQTFFSRLQSDPALMAGVLRMGTQLMQPMAPGQTRAGHFAGALEHSVDYAAASRAARTEEARKGMLAQSEVAQRGAQTGAVTQETEQKRQLFPNALAQSEAKLKEMLNENKKAQYELDQLNAMTTAGLRSPEHLQRVAQAELRLKNSHANFYDAHANLYNQTADSSKGQSSQMKVDNADGTTSIVYSHLKKGQRYIETVTPARYSDENQALAQAQKDVEKITPFFGQAPYQGTKANEVARRVKMYLTPQRSIVGPGGQQVTPEQFQRLDEGAGPKAIGAAVAGQTNVSTELSGGGNIVENLKQIDAELARNPHPVALKALEDEKVRLLNAQSGVATQIGPEGARAVGKGKQVLNTESAVTWERGPDGRARQVGSAQTVPSAGEDTTKYVRSRIRGGWDYTPGAHGSGKTKKEWAAIDAGAK